MTDILQTALPSEMAHRSELPGVSPCDADDWLRVDDAYALQMGYREVLLAEKTADVLQMEDSARPAAEELLEEVLRILPGLGFARDGGDIHRPDGRKIRVDHSEPLHTLGHLVQEDLCILERRGDQHVLTGAVLCFPANWRLDEKMGKPLTTIHEPVEAYDAGIAKRVQRLFDGVKTGRPLRRHNRLAYAGSELHQPSGRSMNGPMPFLRSERQCILRLPRTDAVVFSIHTWVVRV